MTLTQKLILNFNLSPDEANTIIEDYLFDENKNIDELIKWIKEAEK